MLVTFLGFTYREVEATLLRAARERARIAADQIAGMLGTSFRAATEDNSSLAVDPDIRGFLRDPSEETREAARRALAPHAATPSRRVELWNAAGELVLELATPSAPDSGSAPWFFPAGEHPTREGVSELGAVGEASFFDIVVEIRDGSSPAAAHLGYLRRFGRITSTPGGAVRRLVGSDAVVRIGTIGGPVWTDFFSVVEAPPIGADTMDGRRWVGAFAEVEGTPWVAWVGFPRALIVAPAQTFLQRMAMLALLFVAVCVALVGMLGIRLTQPLHALARAAEELAAGDYTRRVGAGKRDEVGRLSEAFDTMADRIEAAHGALRESHEQTHFALSAARIGVWESQLAAGQMACSDSMRLVLGVPAEALPRTRDAFLALVHLDDRESVRALLEGRTTNGEVFDLTCRVAWPDGSIHWIEGKGRVKSDAAGRPVSVLGVCMDVTERRRLEAQLRQSQKLEAVGRLAGGIAHDFNNLLNVIQGCAYLLHSELPEGSALRADAAEIDRAANRAASLTQQLLAFSRKQVLQPKVIEPNEVVREVVKLLGRTIREDIDLITFLDPELCRVEVDPGQLHQVLMNLAVNARDAMPHGGKLTIESNNVDVTEEDARRYSVTPGAYACLRVRDTGTGMDPETQAQIFEPFFTTKEVGKGTGLGLATVYGIVKQSGGYIRVMSEPGAGASFEIYLPQALRERREEAPPSAPATEPGGGETILVVEDDPSLRKLFRRVLEGAGYTVLQAGNGEDALRVAEHHDGTIDLVVSDVIMPVMSGVEMAEHLSRRFPGLRFLFTSGYAEEEIARHGVQASGATFLQKPIAPDVLLGKVRECLTSGFRMQERTDQAGLAP